MISIYTSQKPSVFLTFDEDTKRFQSHVLEHDFIRLYITRKDGTTIKEYHTHISDPATTCRKHGRPLRLIKKKNDILASGGLPFNVHMIMIDAQSIANMHRQVPKLMDMLEEDEDAMLFKAHGIHGDGTTCQLLATLAGMFNLSWLNYLFKSFRILD